MASGTAEIDSPRLYLQILFEERDAAYEQNRPVDPQLSGFDHLLHRMPSDLAGRLGQELKDEEFRECRNAVLSAIEFEGRTAGLLLKNRLRIRELYRNNPPSSGTKDFGEYLIFAFEHRPESKFTDLDGYFRKLSEDPISGLWVELKSLIRSRRLCKRYLRSRFRMEMRKRGWRQSRRFQREREFQHWWRKNGLFANGYVNLEECSAAYQKWCDERSDEDALLYYALSLYTQRDAELQIWQQIIFLESDFLFKEGENFEIDLKEFSAKVLNRARTHLKEFDFAYHLSLLNRKQELSLPYEIELAHLAALMADNISINLNEGMRNAIRVRHKPHLIAKLEAISANMLMAIDESKTGELRRNDGDILSKSIKNRVADLLRHEEPQAHPRQTTLGEHQEDGAFDKAIEEIALREEARLLISEAKLSVRESQILELMCSDLTETAIAQRLHVPVGTVRSRCHRLKAKLRKAKANIESRTNH